MPVIDLISDFPPFRPDLAAYLLPALVRGTPTRTLYLCVVDPGVGTARAIICARVGSAWYLAPDNGLLSPLLRSTRDHVALWRIDWRPAVASATFHGRDIFTPIALQIAAGSLPAASTPIANSADLVGAELPATLAAVCYIDHYGNVVSGMRAGEVDQDAVITVGETLIPRARTFADVALGHAFWYENAFGLLEIAVNQGNAAEKLRLRPGDPLRFHR